MNAKDDRITIRFDPVLGRKVRELAKRRGLSVAEYCRLMCLLEVVNDEPDSRLVNQELKMALADVEALAQDPEAQLPVLRQAVEAVDKLREASKTATTWLLAVTRAVDAYTRQKGEGTDARSRHEGGPGTPDPD